MSDSLQQLKREYSNCAWTKAVSLFQRFKLMIQLILQFDVDSKCIHAEFSGFIKYTYRDCIWNVTEMFWMSSWHCVGSKWPSRMLERHLFGHIERIQLIQIESSDDSNELLKSSQVKSYLWWIHYILREYNKNPHRIVLLIDSLTRIYETVIRPWLEPT